jgi:hypothetical protein
MAGRGTVVLIAALLAVAFLAKPNDPRMSRGQPGPAPRTWRYRCRDCKHIVTETELPPSAPRCPGCGGETSLIGKRRQG